jgi:hypothetical protein
MKKIISIFLFIVAFVLLFQTDMWSQCPMCKLSAESNLRDGGTAGKGLNTGILYMFVLPYMIVGSLAYLWMKNKKNYDAE